MIRHMGTFLIHLCAVQTVTQNEVHIFMRSSLTSSSSSSSKFLKSRSYIEHKVSIIFTKLLIAVFHASFRVQDMADSTSSRTSSPFITWAPELESIFSKDFAVFLFFNIARKYVRSFSKLDCFISCLDLTSTAAKNSNNRFLYKDVKAGGKSGLATTRIPSSNLVSYICGARARRIHKAFALLKCSKHWGKAAYLKTRIVELWPFVAEAFEQIVENDLAQTPQQYIR